MYSKAKMRRFSVVFRTWWQMETGDEGKGNLLQVPVNGIGSWSRVGGTCDGDARRWAGVTTVRGRLRLESG